MHKTVKEKERKDKKDCQCNNQIKQFIIKTEKRPQIAKHGMVSASST